jgi:hypothetical protein
MYAPALLSLDDREDRKIVCEQLIKPVSAFLEKSNRKQIRAMIAFSALRLCDLYEDIECSDVYYKSIEEKLYTNQESAARDQINWHIVNNEMEEALLRVEAFLLRIKREREI